MEEGRVPLESDKWQVASNKFPIQRLGDDTDFDSDFDFDFEYFSRTLESSSKAIF